MERNGERNRERYGERNWNAIENVSDGTLLEHNGECNRERNRERYGERNWNVIENVSDGTLLERNGNVIGNVMITFQLRSNYVPDYVP